MGRAELNPPDSRKSHRAAAGAADRGLFSPCPREPPQLCPPQALGPTPQPLSTAQRGGEVAKQPAATASSPATFCPCAHRKLVPAATRRCSRCHSAAAETACTKPGNGNMWERWSPAAPAGARRGGKGQQVQAAARGKSS